MHFYEQDMLHIILIAYMGKNELRILRTYALLTPYALTRILWSSAWKDVRPYAQVRVGVPDVPRRPSCVHLPPIHTD